MHMPTEKNNKVKEELSVYEALRNSILSTEERVINTKCYMYVLYFTLLGFGIEFPHLLTISYLVLIVFQTMINGDKMGAEKASTYIRVFFEESRAIHWESLHKDSNHFEEYKRMTRDVGWYIDKYSATILSIISSILFTLSVFQTSTGDGIPPLDVVYLFVSYLLCGLAIYINIKQYSNNGKVLEELEKTIRNFQTNCYREAEILETQASKNVPAHVAVSRRKIGTRRKVRGDHSAIDTREAGHRQRGQDRELVVGSPGQAIGK